MIPLVIGKKYNMNTRAPAILGATITNAEFDGSVSYEIARMHLDIQQRYRAVYPNLPVGTPDNMKACIYHIFTAENGSKIVMADQWIDGDSVVEVDGINFTITFTNASVTQRNQIQQILNAMGVTNFTVGI